MTPLHANEYNGLKLYHISSVNHNGEIFYPRVPENRMKTEDNETPRICFAPTMEGAYRAVKSYPKHLDFDLFFLHVPDDMEELRDFNSIVVPAVKEVPDVLYTDELWCLDPVKMRCIGITMFLTVYEPDGYEGRWITKPIDVTDIMEDYYGPFQNRYDLDMHDVDCECLPDDLMFKLMSYV